MVDEVKKIESKEEEFLKLMLRKSFFFPSAEIYSNNLAGFYDFGPYGESVRRKMIAFWRKQLVEKENFVEIFGSPILPESVFIASGHLKNFNDPLTQCIVCKTAFRADNLISDHINVSFPEGLPENHFDELLKEHKIKCPKCKGELGKTRRFNMLMKTMIGSQQDLAGYLRGEACQNIFLDFDRIFKTSRKNLPLGIAQAGLAFRNEINPRNTLLRQRCFGQMDVEVFFNPQKIDEVNRWDEIKDYKLNLSLLKNKETISLTCQEIINKKLVSGKLVAYLLARVQQFYNKLGIDIEKIRFRELAADERAFYSKETWDFETLIESRWVELMACNYRTDYDLKGHGEISKQNLSVNEGLGEFIPHIFELSAGIDRSLYMLLYANFNLSGERGEGRNYLSLPAILAPHQAAIFPLVKKDGLNELSFDLFQELLNFDLDVFFDDRGSVGKRYARMDEIGCPYCLTIDYQTKEDKTITIRDRDSMTQKRILLKDAHHIIWDLIAGRKTFAQL